MRHPGRALLSLRYRSWVWATGLDLQAESLDRLGIHQRDGMEYDNSGGPDLRAALCALDLDNIPSVLDIGCGKGGALIDFHYRGYRKLGGIDLSERVLKICRSNLTKAGIEATLINADASTFQDFEDYELLYIWNTLPEDRLADLLANIRKFSARTKASRLMLFINPLWELTQLLSRTPGVTKIGEYRRDSYYSLYRVEDLSCNYIDPQTTSAAV
jgi:SAM-dependent methyltransferase